MDFGDFVFTPLAIAQGAFAAWVLGLGIGAVSVAVAAIRRRT